MENLVKKSFSSSFTYWKTMQSNFFDNSVEYRILYNLRNHVQHAGYPISTIHQKLVEKEGIEVELVEFTDYVQPNQALENGDVDLNSFQTIIYLERFNKEQGTHIKPIGYTVIAPMGVYSKKIKNVSELKDGDTIAIPEDTPYETIAAMIADEAAIGVINQKTTAVRIIPKGKEGDMIEFGGLLGTAPVMSVNHNSSADFIKRGGQIPAPVHSFKN